MTPTPGILYQIGDKIVCAEELMPYKYYDFFANNKDRKRFNKAYKSWLKSCKNVVNYYQMGENLFRIELTETQLSPCIESGQKCLFVPEGDGVRVIKLK